MIFIGVVAFVTSGATVVLLDVVGMVSDHPSGDIGTANAGTTVVGDSTPDAVAGLRHNDKRGHGGATGYNSLSGKGQYAVGEFSKGNKAFRWSHDYTGKPGYVAGTSGRHVLQGVSNAGVRIGQNGLGSARVRRGNPLFAGEVADRGMSVGISGDGIYATGDTHTLNDPDIGIRAGFTWKPGGRHR